MNSDILSKIIADNLDSNSVKLAKQFFSNDTHVSANFFILDNLLPKEVCLDIYKNFPNKDIYNYRDTFRERKFDYAKLNTLDNPLVDNIANAFQSDTVIKAVERITKINGLESDPTLYAGGISRMDIGHFLNPHIDNSHELTKTKYRRINTLFYVTPGVKESDGGNFELWDSKVKNPLKIPSMFNRLVVMETNKYSWHSVDHVQSNINRCCVSNYYFSEGSPEKYDYFHVTSFNGRPNEKFKRFYSVIDNFLRNSFKQTTGYSRGKSLIRDIK